MKTVLITGGTRGIGLACVERFAEEGYRVATLYKNSRKIAEELSSRLGVTAMQCDVSDPDEVKAAASHLIEEFGTVDVLVNNAGISYSGLLQDMTDSDWNNVIATNLSSAFFVSREIIPLMVRQGSGCIINVASMWGVTGASCEVAYSSAKAGLIGFTKALAKELAPSGIRVNAVAPGAISTDMMSEYSKDDVKAIAEETPLGRIGSTKNIADAVYFLSCESAEFITGEVLNVNGGFVI